MAFSLKFSDTAARQFDALDPPLQKRVKIFLEDACALVDPAVRFERLHGKLSGLWKRREGHLRMIVEVDRGRVRVRVLVLKIGRRDDVYEVDKNQLKRFVLDREEPPA